MEYSIEVFTADQEVRHEVPGLSPGSPSPSAPSCATTVAAAARLMQAAVLARLRQGAGTDAGVYLFLHGQTGSSERLELKSDEDVFQPGSHDT